MDKSDLQQEWLLLQRQYDEYEKCTLWIKLAALVALGSCYFAHQTGRTLLVILLCLWTLEAIWKTYQSRIGLRLETIERGLLAESPPAAMQFNSQWLANRPSTSGLIYEYAKQGLKPTVAFPHAIFVLLSLYWL